MVVKENVHSDNTTVPGKKTPLIYALTDEIGTVFYVGKTTNLDVRMKDHRDRFGDDVSVRVLQDSFPSETPRAAEKRWIEHYRDQGVILRNSNHNDRHPLRETETVGTVNIAKMRLKTWKIFRDRCEQIGVLLPAALEEAIFDWMEKSHLDGYEISNDNERIARLREKC